MEHFVHIVRLFLLVKENLFLVILLQVVSCRHQESGCTAGRIADNIVSCRIHQFYHHADNMTRGTELTVKPRLRDFWEKILINIASDITFLEFCHFSIDIIKNGDNFIKKQRCRNLENCIVHILGICAILIIMQVLDKWEHPFLNDRIHFSSRIVVEYRPFELIAVDLSLTHFYLISKDALMRKSKHNRFFCAKVVGIVKVADKHQICNLLNYV